MLTPGWFTRDRFVRDIAFLSLLLGCWAAWFYYNIGLTLSHYDTKGHLVVARRVFDSLTPGWKQLGAVWLPLPHLLNLLPVQIDAFYRTGASAVAISVLSFAIAAAGAARIVLRTTQSKAAAVAAWLVLALNPDLLYLQSTPMTEALLIALLVMSASLTLEWLEEPTDRKRRFAGFTIAAACLTRYEAWPFTVALLALSAIALRSRSSSYRAAVARVWQIGRYPAVAVGAFLVFSRVTVGKWFVTDGFFAIDNIDTGNPFRAIGSVWWGAHMHTGYPVLFIAVAGIIATIVVAWRNRNDRAVLVLLAMLAVGALPAYAFFKGHPFRVRYMTPLVPAIAIYAGFAVAFIGSKYRKAAAVVVVAAVLLHSRPVNLNAPMLLEAQWDSGNAAARRQITRYFAAHYDGRPVLASMASLAHCMQESSNAGLRLRDFLHEGNGDQWFAALRHPHAHVGWVLMEEWSEGGDRLSRLAGEDPKFLAGFERVAEGGGVALYRALREGPNVRESEGPKVDDSRTLGLSDSVGLGRTTANR